MEFIQRSYKNFDSIITNKSNILKNNLTINGPKMELIQRSYKNFLRIVTNKGDILKKKLT